MNWVKDGIEKAAKFVKGEKLLDKDFPILKGHPKARVNAREASENIGGLSEKMEGKRNAVKEFQIYRWNPDKPYFVDLSTCGPMVWNHLFHQFSCNVVSGLQILGGKICRGFIF